MHKTLTILRQKFKEFLNLWKFYGFLPAFYTLVWWLNFYIHTPVRFKFSKWALLHKTKWLDKYINSNYKDIIDHYKVLSETKVKIDVPNIWVFWGQGEQNMPILVKACYSQLKINHENVNLITTDNLAKYIEISPIVIQKVLTKEITWAHFSDLIRTSLLAKYGGMWVDATCWIPNKIQFEKLIKWDLFSPNGKVDYKANDICFWTSFGLNWSGWCLWTNHKNSKLYSFVADMLSNMIIKEKMTIDYVLVDYLIYYAINNFSDVRKEFIKIQKWPCNNRNVLAQLMNKPFDEKEYHDLCSDDFIFKLSYRAGWKSFTSDGKLTYYGKLINSDTVNNNSSVNL